MIYKGYLGKVEFDEEARVLAGEVVGLRDVITFQADSAANIEKEFHASVDDYLAFCKKRGESPEKSASGKFIVRVDAELHRRLSMLAEEKGESLNALVQEYLSAEVQRHLADRPRSKARTRPVTRLGARPVTRPAKRRRATAAEAA